jgi:hypothetical protein
MMSRSKFVRAVIVVLAAVWSLMPSSARGQGCIDGLPIRPTYTSSSNQYWGSSGVAVSASDVFLASNSVSSGTVAVMRLTGASGLSQVQQIATGNISVLRAAADMFFVGSTSGNGSVRIYRRQTAGTYSLSTTINGPISGELFAYAVAVNEDATVLAVGAPDAGSAPNAFAGKVYVYARNLSTGAWALQATLGTPSGPVFNTSFGSSVSASGSRIAIDEGGTATTRVFLRTGMAWAQEAAVTHSAGGTTSLRTVRLSEDILWIRNPNNDRFDVFERSGSAWSLRQTLVLAGVRGLAFSSGVMCVSRQVSLPERGIEIQTFRRSGSANQWANFSTVRTPALNSNDTNHLAMSGDLAVVDANSLNFGSVYGFGAAFLFDINFTDCNGNGVRDECDIASGTATDANANGVPDSCESLCRPDLNGDGFVDGNDLGILLNGWGACPN